MPKIGKRVHKNFLADPDMAVEIDEFRFANRYHSEGAAMRDIVRAGLRALKAPADQQERKTELRAA